MAPNYAQTYARSLRDPEAFWAEAAAAVQWYRKWDKVLDDSNPPFYRWFTGGIVNTCYNALDIHVEHGRGDQPALIYDSPVTSTIKTFTYRELRHKVAHFAGVLAQQGVEKGDRVIIYMPMVPETVIAMLACARIGAIHSVVFGGFAAHELATRIDDATPKLILSASCGIEPDRIVAYKPLLDEAIETASSKPQACIILQRPQAKASMIEGRDLDWSEALKSARPIDCVPVAATDPLYILYTSGTTGIPKGVVRDNGGHLVALKWSMKNVYGVEPGEVFWAASDLGWAVGHSYIVYAPLFNGNTTVLYEGKPVGTPDPGAFWRVISQHGVSVLFTAPTVFRAIRREDPEGKFIAAYFGRDAETGGQGEGETGRLGGSLPCPPFPPSPRLPLSPSPPLPVISRSLRTLFLAGERCDPNTLQWAEKQLGVPVMDHWWQTETGWPVGANCVGLGALPVKAGSCTKAVPGYDVRVLDDTGFEVKKTEIGNIAIKLPLPPGCLATLWNNDEAYQSSYLTEYPGYYQTADAGFIDEDGYIWIMSRTDDIINVSGHRLSTGGIEEVLASHPDVAECAVVGVSDEIKGEVPLGLVVLKAGVLPAGTACGSGRIGASPSPLAEKGIAEEVSDAPDPTVALPLSGEGRGNQRLGSGNDRMVADRVVAELVQLVRDQIGPVACFKVATVVKRLPKTRSGKIVRGTIKKIADGVDYRIPPTIDDPAILDEITADLAALGYPRS